MICLPPLAKQYFPCQRRSQIEKHMVLSEPKFPPTPPPESKISGSVPAKGTLRQNWPTSQTSSVVNAEKYEYLNISGYFYLVVTNHSKGKLENHKLITIVACSIVNFTSDCFFPWNTLTLQIYF